MSKIVVESHKIVTMEHEMRMEGHYLTEKRQKTIISPVKPAVEEDFDQSDNEPETVILVHLRVIDDQSHKVTEIYKNFDEAPEREIETNLDDDELTVFEENWTQYWKPSITKKAIENLG